EVQLRIASDGIRGHIIDRRCGGARRLCRRAVDDLVVSAGHVRLLADTTGAFRLGGADQLFIWESARRGRSYWISPGFGSLLGRSFCMGQGLFPQGSGHAVDGW